VIWLKFLHIGIMFAAVALAVGGEVILTRAASTKNVVAIRSVFGAAAPVMRFVPMAFGLGALVGVIAALVGDFNPLAPWLIAAYVLFVIAAVVGARAGAWARSVGMAAGKSPEDAPSAELVAAIEDPQARMLRWVNYLIVAVFIALMVWKPGA